MRDVTGLEPPVAEVLEAIERARRILWRAGFVVDDEVESEIGWVVAQCHASYSRQPRPYPFARYASRSAYNRCLRLLVRREAMWQACQLMGWQDSQVEDGQVLPLRRAMRDLVATLPASVSGVARDVWLGGKSRRQVSRERGMTRRDVAVALEAAARRVIRDPER